MKKNIFLLTIAQKHPFVYIPYAVGCLISHCLKDELIAENYNFFEPGYRYDCEKDSNFEEQLKQTDILGFTCYVWNQVTNDRISKRFKEINPNGIVVYGGPNVPENKEIASFYKDDRPFVDVFFVGPGEINFSNFLKKYHLTNTFEEIEGTFTQKQNYVNLTRESYAMDSTPTPILDGLFDKILERESSIIIPLESNRGCPYKCTFCDWGGLTQSKIFQLDFDVVKQNIEKTIQYKSVNKFTVTDANFGFFARDVEIIDHLIQQKNKFNKKIELSILGVAKNSSEYVKEIYSKMHLFDVEKNNSSLKNMKVSFQTFSNDTLSVIDRKNMSKEKLLEVIDRTIYKSVTSELIIGLPGETPNSWLDTIAEHEKLNILDARMYHLHILPNVPMMQKDYIEKHKIKTTKLYVPVDLISTSYQDLARNIYNAENIKTKFNFETEKLNFETFDVMSSCFSFTNEELKLIYLYSFWFDMFYNTKILVDETKKSKLTIQDQVKLFFNLVDSGKMPLMKQIVDNHKKILDKVFTTEPMNVLTDLQAVSFINLTMGRSSELFVILDNLDQFEKEIKLIYPEFSKDQIVYLSDYEKPVLFNPFAVLNKNYKSR